MRQERKAFFWEQLELYFSKLRNYVRINNTLWGNNAYIKKITVWG